MVIFIYPPSTHTQLTTLQPEQVAPEVVWLPFAASLPEILEPPHYNMHSLVSLDGFCSHLPINFSNLPANFFLLFHF